MNITSAKFIKSVLGTNEILGDGTPQVVMIGRSNVGKSSLINALTDQKDLARISRVPGCTQMINVFSINNAFYLIDLPGYGFAQASMKERERINKMIYWYLLESPYKPKKVFVIIDAKVGPTVFDLEVLQSLKGRHNVTVLVNKIDKLKRSESREQLQKIEDTVGCKVIPCSAKMNIGMSAILDEISL